MAKVLIVEDDHSTADLLKDVLSSEHHTAETSDNGKDALYMLENYFFDLAIVDWELPDISGPDIVKHCRDKGLKLKFLMLTGRRQTSDKVKGLDSGSDDYLTKPFEIVELTARIRALLRRPDSTQSNDIVCGAVALDPVSHQVRVNDKEVKLLPTEYALLEFFLRHQNQVFSIQAILDRVWRSESDSSESAVRTCIVRLRKKLNSDENSNPRIVSVHGFGYKLVSDK